MILRLSSGRRQTGHRDGGILGAQKQADRRVGLESRLQPARHCAGSGTMILPLSSFTMSVFPIRDFYQFLPFPIFTT